MGNEVSTIGGAIGVAATSVVAGVCLGQCETLNNAVKDTAKFTATNFMNSNVRHIGETVGVSVAAAVTLGQCESVNRHLEKCSAETAEVVCETVNGLLDEIPVVGHIKGAVHYAVGDSEGGDKAMKSASRKAGVIAGGALGLAGGPAGMIAGGIAGGAVMDGVITGVDSAVHSEYKPNGQIASWTQFVNPKSSEDVWDGLKGVVTTPISDGLIGRSNGMKLHGSAK